MGEEEKVEEVKERKLRFDMKSPIVRALLVGIGAVAALIVIVVTVKLVTTRIKPPELPPLEAIPEVEPTEPLSVWLAGEESIIARLADKDEPHMVKVDEIYLAHHPKYKLLPTELTKKRFKIRSIINGVFMSKKSTDLDSEEGKRLVTQELVAKINKILTKGRISDIYMQIVVQ
jgi:flagellar basal body-associated protein FliL